MSTLLTDEIEPTEDWQAEELEGHIRAIEAILLELADVSTLRNAFVKRAKMKDGINSGPA